MNYSLRTLTIVDYPALLNLLSATPGVTVRDADSHEATRRYLERNPGLSFVAEANGALARGELVACLMAGHDGRRGYLQHLVVSPSWRRQGIAGALVERCLTELERLGIRKSHLDVFHTNADGAAFWEAQGWALRTDIKRYSMIRGGGENT